MAAPCIGKRGGGRTELRLQLVGAERVERRNSHDQHRRDGDETATAGDGIDKSGKDGDAEKDEENVEGDVLHLACPGRRKGEDLFFHRKDRHAIFFSLICCSRGDCGVAAYGYVSVAHRQERR